MEDFVIENMAVAIIDTYENERVLIEEFAGKASIQLSWDGGDDLYSPYMASELTFSMAVTDKIDGKFKHLLTGDEKRYKVQVLNIDSEDNELLIWQGYILPDLYSEPYKNGVLFVEFTAIDMIASLKGKYFEPWYYFNKFNINVLLARLLAFTGLEQQLLVKPMLENVDYGTDWMWRHFNVNLEPYQKDGEYTDLYDILMDVLAAQGMTLVSYRGYWVLQGITRKIEYNGPAEVYNPDGSFAEHTTVENKVTAPFFKADAPYITADTPWKAVNLNFEEEEGRNLYPEGVVLRDFYATRFYDDDFVLPSYVTELMGYWNKTGCPYTVLEYGLPYLRWVMLPGYDYSLYNQPEATIWSNYIASNYSPYVYAGRVYELELEVLVYFQVTYYGDIQQRIEGGVFDKMMCFQVFLNGTEIMSNRPSFPSSSLYKCEKVWYALNDYETPGAAAAATWKLKRKFKATESGAIDFRFLPPIGTLDENDIVDYYVEPKVLKINVVNEAVNNESVRAVRGIGYTKELDIDLKLTCSVDSAVQKSLGLGISTGAEFTEVPYSSPVFFINQHEFLPTTEVSLWLYRFPITFDLQDALFVKGNTRKLFIEHADGEREPYPSVFTGKNGGVPQMVLYTGFVSSPFGAEPELPDDYEPMALPAPTDVLKYMHINFAPEYIINRALWRLYGRDDASAKTYLRTLADAYHSVRPDVCNSIEGEAFALVFPLQLVQFKYDGLRQYFPTRLQLILDTGKTQITMKEVKNQELTDITYE